MYNNLYLSHTINWLIVIFAQDLFVSDYVSMNKEIHTLLEFTIQLLKMYCYVIILMYKDVYFILLFHIILYYNIFYIILQ